ncbi:unnamed protein product [Brassica oleracea var. botrytis]|uniref:F-box domain-containing protein n=2 Tax=Brassica TaxID=3705 RepID=A0A0D3C179_BRAOL|nr:unnamed protein product [Brassica napus]
MNGKETSHSIPTDLKLEILSRLPIKSIARFRCVSKLWGSMFCSPYFTGLFQIRSSARPHLLFAVELNNGFILFSSSSDQRKNSYDKSSVVVATMSLTDRKQLVFCGYASGQRVKLPILTMGEEDSYNFLGFDPIDKQFKGKLCGIHRRRRRQYASTGGKRTIELGMRVLEDTEKEEWSEHVYTFPEDIIVDPFSIIIVGVTDGEIVLSGD